MLHTLQLLWKQALKEQKEEGFTLVELLIAIGIIAILASIIIIAINPIANIESAQNRAGEKQAREIKSAITQHIIDHGAAPNVITATPQVICSDGFVPTDGDCEIDLKNEIANSTDSDYAFIAKIPQHPAFSAPNSGHRTHIDGSFIQVEPLEQTVKVYWINTATDSIYRANSDGTSPEEIITDIDTTDSYVSIAVDTTNDKVYWMDETKILKRANYDGTNQETAYDLSGGGGFYTVIAVDGVNQHMYYAAAGFTDHGLRRVNFDGSNDLAVGTYNVGPKFDFTNNKVYLGWNNFFGSKTLYRRNTDGTGDETLATYTSGGGGFDIDVEEGKLYYINYDSSELVQADLDGTNRTTILTDVLGSALYMSYNTETDQIYYGSYGNNQVRRVDNNGANDTTISTDGSPQNIGFAHTNDKVLIDHNGASLTFADFDGSNSTVISATSAQYAIGE